MAILTSGGDAQGMNAAVRAVVRTGLSLGAEVYAVYEGYQGMVDGGDGIRRLEWDDVGSILHRGGTVIGTFRSRDFRTREGRLKAAANLVERGIDRLVVIGGDGSLSGLDLFKAEWTGLLAELVESGRLGPEQTAAHPELVVAGLVGSIDNDLVGADITIGADSALHRIVDAIDAIASTAASHQRSFVVEVMGRHCGYLALVAALAGGCDYVLIPENPPADGWEERMCATLRRGRDAGRRDSIVLIAEGAQDRAGTPITSAYVRDVIEQTTGEDTRVTILGHVQRGGAPSAFDRWASSWLGCAAAHEVLEAPSDSPPTILALRHNQVSRLDLVEAVAATRRVPELIAAGDFDAAMALRGGSFTELVQIFAEMSEPPAVPAIAEPRRVAIMHGGGLAPGMNTAARAAVRLGLDRGHVMLGVRGGFPGLRDGLIDELAWDDVEGWAGLGGAELGTRRRVPPIEELYAISRQLEQHRVDALLVIGGWNAYQGAQRLQAEADRYPAFAIPIVCVPASIDNNLPNSHTSIGADTALNSIVEAIDKIKQSASAAHRCFVVETMGRHCGYLAAMGGLASGAERVYLHEEGITLQALAADVEAMRVSFRDDGRKLFLTMRNEGASEHYTTDFLARLFEEEAHGAFDVRQVVLGHVQQGGNPSPFDRVLATRLVAHAMDVLTRDLAEGESGGHTVGVVDSGIVEAPLSRIADVMDTVNRRPRKQWWMALRPVAKAVAGQWEGV